MRCVGVVADLEASEDRLHPGIQLQLLDSDILQGVWVLPLAAALHHAQEAVQIKSNNAWEPFEPVHQKQHSISACCQRRLSKIVKTQGTMSSSREVTDIQL